MQQYTSFSCIWCLHFVIDSLSNYSDFLKRHLYLRNRLLDQGYNKIRLIRSLKKFIFRYQDLVKIYSVSAEMIINDGFHIVKMNKDKESTKMFLTFTFVVKILQVTQGCWWRWFTIDVAPSSLNWYCFDNYFTYFVPVLL